ncbi:hypothetical protein [Pedobacter arcticus]|uniref:hypothetical protein n=1 Tax=Pedobacter arcticus TaxID=752140 RepID=UPI00030CB88C|nr:hypothetical protein [Pedobacter arcticus]
MNTSAYELYNDKIGIKLSYLLSDIDKCTDDSLAVLSYSAYEKRALRVPGFRLKEGRGPGNEVLIDIDAMPSDWYDMAVKRFSLPKQETHPMANFFKMDADARIFYDKYQFESNGEFLTPAQRKRYTINASVMGALASLKTVREMAKKSRGGRATGIWASLVGDCISFNDYLKAKHSCSHSLPKSEKMLRERYNRWIDHNYESIIDGRNNNSNAQLVTPEMIRLWQDIYAGQLPYKPSYNEVSERYDQFLAGQISIGIRKDSKNEDSPNFKYAGEIYDNTLECYKPASESTVYAYQSAWELKVVSHSLRSGDRQRFKGLYIPFHKLKQPDFAGTMISIDDRKPPFEYAKGKRLWFYCGADLGSEVITTYVYGETKEGIIEEFYRQMVRNYAGWGLSLPYELECESSLNSTYKDDLLAPGSMFTEVRIEANNARGKAIEQYWRQIRYGKEFDKKHHAWIGRPFSVGENNQRAVEKVEFMPKVDIVKSSIDTIQLWNSQLHSNQTLHPGMTREDVFLEKQHPELTPINWAGILPHIGFSQKSSMKAGRIILQGLHRVVGFNGEVALGEILIQILQKIEGQTVQLYWLDDNEGDVLKALVYDLQGTQICELLGDLEYSRGKLESKDSDKDYRSIMSAYEATVQGYINRNAKEINSITIIDEEVKPARKNRLQFKNVEQYRPADKPAEMLAPIESEFETPLKPNTSFDTSTKSRFR